MSDFEVNSRTAEYGRVSASLIAGVSLLRGLVLVFSSRPRTLLRVLCVVAFDTLFVLRKRKRLPMHKLKALAVLLDLGACVNTYFDAKGFSRAAYRATRVLAKDAGGDPLVKAYLSRLRALEQGRPAPGGDGERFEATRSYREAVARLSLVLITASAFDTDTLAQGDELFGSDDCFDIVFRIVMLCQVLDDVLDRKKDAAAGLPSFLTATASGSEAFALTRGAVASYRDVGALSPARSAFPFLVALSAVSAVTRCVLAFSRRRRA